MAYVQGELKFVLVGEQIVSCLECPCKSKPVRSQKPLRADWLRSESKESATHIELPMQAIYTQLSHSIRYTQDPSWERRVRDVREVGRGDGKRCEAVKMNNGGNTGEREWEKMRKIRGETARVWRKTTKQCKWTETDTEREGGRQKGREDEHSKQGGEKKVKFRSS